MATLLQWGVVNGILVTLLAAGVALVGRWVRRPALIHALWILVLVIGRALFGAFVRMEWIALFAGLAEMETDLHRHIHLENAVLFPIALALAEKQG